MKKCKIKAMHFFIQTFLSNRINFMKGNSQAIQIFGVLVVHYDCMQKILCTTVRKSVWESKPAKMHWKRKFLCDKSTVIKWTNVFPIEKLILIERTSIWSAFWIADEVPCLISWPRRPPSCAVFFERHDH